MAAAAERRHANLLENALLRYLRLALPVLASILLAYLWLRLMPNAAGNLARSLDAPSEWLAFTAQGPLPGLGAAIHDGLAGSFITGMSPFNNVLWGHASGNWSVRCSCSRPLLAGRVRTLGALCRIGRVRPVGPAGAARYLSMFRNRRAFVRGPQSWDLAEVAAGHRAAGVGLGDDAGHARRQICNKLAPRIRAGPFVSGQPLGLGTPSRVPRSFCWRRFSFGPCKTGSKLRHCNGLDGFPSGLYLVHVPILYTFLAWERLTLGLPELLLFPAYLAAVLALAYLFTLVVDEPTLRLLGRIREQLARLRSLTPRAQPDRQRHRAGLAMGLVGQRGPDGHDPDKWRCRHLLRLCHLPAPSRGDVEATFVLCHSWTSCQQTQRLPLPCRKTATRQALPRPRFNSAGGPYSTRSSLGQGWKPGGYGHWRRRMR